MVGNSLLLEGVDVNRLRKLTSDRMRVYPIFLEATGYYDWLYGLERLFRKGSRPQVVVLGLGVNSFLSNGVRQDYAPMMFFDAQDALGVASELKLDRTTTSNLLLAHSSVFWDTRSVIRTQILRHTVPRCRELFLFLKPQPTIPPAPVFEAAVNSRLVRLRALCEAHGAKLIILIPPTLSSEDAPGKWSPTRSRPEWKLWCPSTLANPLRSITSPTNYISIPRAQRSLQPRWQLTFPRQLFTNRWPRRTSQTGVGPSPENS